MSGMPMDRASRSVGGGWKFCVRLGVYLFIAICSVAIQVPSQVAPETGHGALEITSGLGRKLYALPDGENVISARSSCTVQERGKR
jgi:hypothetical protein